MYLLPSYRRPKQCAEVVKAIRHLGCELPGILLVNGLDDATEYAKIKLPDSWKLVVLPQNIGLCGAMAWVFAHYPNEPFYGLLSDDEYTYSSGWEKRLTEAAGTKFIAHGNDKWQSGRRLHSFVTWGGDLVREVGWWALPGLWHWCIDDAWEQLMAGLNAVRFCDDVYCEHKHYLAGHAQKDYTYHSGESKAGMDRLVFQRWMAIDYPIIKKRLIKFYGEGVV